jgi:tetratricopeptide (TPR) repeat protein
MGNTAQASAQFEKIIKADPRNVEAWTGLAGVYAAQNQFEKAEELYLKAAGLDPLKTLPKKGLANLYIRRKAYDKAWALADELVKANDPEGRILKGQLLIAQNKPAEAIKELQAAVNANRNSVRAHFLLGAAFLQDKKAPQAETEWNEALRIDPGLSAAAVSLTQLKLNSGDPDAALRYVQQGLKANPDLVDLRMILGNVLMVKRDYAAAVKEFEELSKRLPGNAQVSNNLALANVNLYASQNKPDRAIQIVNQQIARNPNDAGLQNLLGQLYLSQKNYAKAEQAYRKALSIDKNNLAAYGLLGQLFMVQNSRDKAIQEFKSALKVNPRSIEARLILGSIYELQNDLEAAKFQYREALDIDPKSPVAANNMAWILAESGGDLDEALQLARTAAERLPDLPNIQDTLGWVHYKKGTYKAAIEILSDCVRKEAKNATYRYHLGMSYYKNGDRQKAKASLEEAIKLNPSFPGIEEAKQTLAKL